MMTLGRDVSELFPAVVKNVVVESMEIKKLVYMYVIHYAATNPNLALLSISSFQKDMASPNPLVRAKALHAMSCMRVSSVTHLIILQLKNAVKDSSSYVRRTAAQVLPAVNNLDNKFKVDLIAMLTTLLADDDVYVLSGALYSFNVLCPNKFDLIHINYRKICHLLADMDEYGQIVALSILQRYARNQFRSPFPRTKTNEGKEEGDTLREEKETKKDDDEDDEDDLLDLTQEEDYIELDPDHKLLITSAKNLIFSMNAQVVLSVVTLLYYCAPNSDCVDAIRALIQFVNFSKREISYCILANISTMATERSELFAGFYKDFYIKSIEAGFLKELKLDILSKIATEGNIGHILQEFTAYAKDPDVKFRCSTIEAMGRCSSMIPDVAEKTMTSLMTLLSPANQSPDVVASSVIVIRQIIQRNPSNYEKSMLKLLKLLQKTNVPAARCAIVWIIGEYREYISDYVPDALRILAKKFIHEANEVKMQILNLAVKVYLADPKKTILLFKYILDLCKYDQNYDLRDRARLVRCVFFQKKKKKGGDSSDIDPDVQRKLRTKMQEMFLSEKKLPEIISPFKDRERFAMNTLSHMVLHSAGDNYKPLEDFPEIPPDNTAKRTPEDTSAALWNTSPRETKKSKEGDFFADSDDSDLQEFDSSDDDSSDDSDSDTDSDDDTTDSDDSDSDSDSDDDSSDLSSDSDDSDSETDSEDDSSDEESSEEKPKRKPVKKPIKKKPEPEPSSESEEPEESESVSSSDIMAEPLFVPKKKEKEEKKDEEDNKPKKRPKVKKAKGPGSSEEDSDEESSSSEEVVVSKKKGKKSGKGKGKDKKGKKGKSKSPPKEEKPEPVQQAAEQDLLGGLFMDMNAKSPKNDTSTTATTTTAAANTSSAGGAFDMLDFIGGGSGATAPKVATKPAEEEKGSSDEEEEEEPVKSKKKGKKGKKGKKKKEESSDESEEEVKPKKGKGKKGKKGKRGKKKKAESSDESGWSDSDEEEEVVVSKKKKKSMSQPKNDEPEEKKVDAAKAKKAKQSQRGDQLSDLFSSVMGPNVTVNTSNDIMGSMGGGSGGTTDDILFGASADSLMKNTENVGFRGELLNHTHTQGLQIDYEFMRQQSRYGVRFNQIRLIFENRWDKPMKGISLNPHNLDKSQQDYRDIFDGGIPKLGPGEKKTDYIHVQFGKTSEMRFDINVQEGTNKNRHTAKIKGIPGELMRPNISYSVEEFLKKKKQSGAMSERNLSCGLDTIDEAANEILKTFNVGIINSGGNLDMSKTRYFAGYLLSDDSDVLIVLETSSGGKITCTVNCTEFMLVDAITGVARQCLTKK